MHLRLKCPADSPGCKPQARVPNNGCGKNLNWWFDVAYNPKPKPKKVAKVKMKKAATTRKRRYRTLSQLPPACRVVLNAPGYDGLGSAPTRAASAKVDLSAVTKVPAPRPGTDEGAIERKDGIADMIAPAADVPRPSVPVGGAGDPFARDAAALRGSE